MELFMPTLPCHKCGVVPLAQLVDCEVFHYAMVGKLALAYQVEEANFILRGNSALLPLPFGSKTYIFLKFFLGVIILIVSYFKTITLFGSDFCDGIRNSFEYI